MSDLHEAATIASRGWTREELANNAREPLRGMIVDLQPSRLSGWAGLLFPIAARAMFRFPYPQIRDGLYRRREAEAPRCENLAARVKTGEAIQRRAQAEQDAAGAARRRELRWHFLRHAWRDNGVSARLDYALAVVVAQSEAVLAPKFGSVLQLRRSRAA